MLAVILAGVAVVMFTMQLVNLEQIGATVDPTVLNVITQHRLFYSPDCFAYEDPITHRVYPGIVDKTKFTEERLQSCFATGDARNYPCFKLEIVAEGQETLGPIHTANYASCSIRSTMIVRPKYVQLQDGNERHRATMTVRFPNPQ